ncbi:MAG: hypothetical protein A2542_00695 [Parcubacteria group bacterium RIFOXYD2_FULL_52_8]|nr:MAG: hypothetical protein A2542_00695 [Parcubacteria group bacterium RIFOXYD2_FULL_52_8]
MSLEDKLLKLFIGEENKAKVCMGVFRWRDFWLGFLGSVAGVFLLQRILIFFYIDGGFLLLVLFAFALTLLMSIVYYWRRKPGIARGILCALIVFFLQIVGGLLFIKLLFG